MGQEAISIVEQEFGKEAVTVKRHPVAVPRFLMASWQIGHTDFTDEDPTGVIIEEGVTRLTVAADRLPDTIERAFHTWLAERLSGEELRTAQTFLSCLRDAEGAVQHLTKDLSLALAPHVRRMGPFEDVLQAAYAEIGIRSEDDADAYIMKYMDTALRDARDVLPDLTEDVVSYRAFRLRYDVGPGRCRVDNEDEDGPCGLPAVPGKFWCRRHAPPKDQGAQE